MQVTRQTNLIIKLRQATMFFLVFVYNSCTWFITGPPTHSVKGID